MKKIILFSLLVFLVACGDNDPIIPQESELITSVEYVLTPMNAAGLDQVVFSFEDIDGDGGEDPVIIEGILKANTTYAGELKLLNNSVSPPIDLTEEINSEALDHQFFFISTKGDLVVNYSDEDSEGNPLGLKTILSSGNPGNGTLTIILRHEPDKFAQDVKNGSIINAGGETDIEVTFNVQVE